MRVLQIKWLSDINKVDDLVNIFINNVGIEYITHIEIEEGRALSINQWSPNLAEIIKAELIEQIGNSKVVVAEMNKVTKGYALIKIENKRLIIEDIVVNQKRIGTEIMNWIENYAKEVGVKFLIADIGLNNQRAQRFMEHLGYQRQTIVYTKQIG
jgi:hypothetical protein